MTLAKPRLAGPMILTADTIKQTSGIAPGAGFPGSLGMASFIDK
jgi:hypothetical protein